MLSSNYLHWLDNLLSILPPIKSEGMDKVWTRFLPWCNTSGLYSNSQYSPYNSIWSLMSTTVTVRVLIKLFSSDLPPQSPILLWFQHCKLSLAWWSNSHWWLFIHLQIVWEQLCHSADSSAHLWRLTLYLWHFPRKTTLLQHQNVFFFQTFWNWCTKYFETTYWQWITLWKWESTRIYFNGATSISM
jgi:hypothetical protein